MKVLTVLTVCSVVLVCNASARPTLVWVETPGAREQTVRSLAEEGQLRWLASAIEQGALWPVSDREFARIDSLRRSVRSFDTPYVDAGSRGQTTSGTVLAGLSGSVRLAGPWLEDGRPSIELLGSWRGDWDWTTIRRLAGIDEALRWEEVEEFLSLTPTQNRTLRTMPPTWEHPLWRIRRAYASDKLFANLALYYGKTERAPRIFLTLALAESFEEDLRPWTDRQLRIAQEDPATEELDRQRRFFLRRIRSSSPRVYDRIDRVLQSLAAEWGSSALIVVDATRSADPFLAIGRLEEIESAASTVERLASLLDRAGWGVSQRP